MKKIFKIMSCAVLAIAITGCGNNPTPSDGSEKVVSLSKAEFKITADELYKSLKESYATNYIIQEIDNKILDTEYETDEAANDYIENQLKIYKMMYGNSDSELLKTLQNAGYKDLEEFKKVILLNYKRNLATKDYVRENISEDKIKKYYENNIYGDITISHILVKLDTNDNMTDEEKAEAEKKTNDKIKEIYEKLADGKTFEEIAKEYSEDTATAKDGGRVGTFNKEEMTKQFNKEFEDAAIALKVGEYTKKAVKSTYGYHIIYKDAEKEKPTMDAVKQTIIDNLIDDEMKDDDKAQYKALIKLREDYGLEFNDDDVKQQYENAKNNWLYSKES